MNSRARIFLAGAIAATIAAVAVAHPGHPPIPPPTVAFAARPLPLPFELFRGTRIFFSGTVNGTATDMMLDSGAGMTVVDTGFAEKLGLSGGVPTQVRGASGEVPGRFISGVDLSVGALRMSKLSVLVIDLAPVARGIGRPIPVVLGRDALKAGLVTIDFPNRTIRFADRKGFTAPAGARRLPLGSDGHLPTVQVSVAGLDPVAATLDIGNGGTILLAASYWKDKPSIASLRSAETQIGGVGGLEIARKVILPRVEFGGTRLADVPAILNQSPTALPTEGGNVGVELLKPFVVTIDDTDGALYLQPTGKAHDFQRERAGVRTELAGDRLKVLYVSPDGPGKAAGLKAGDEIVAVDGRDVGPDYYRHGPEWSRGAAGSKVALKRADGSNALVTLQDYY